MMELRVSDLKQFYYCPRVVYYQYVLPVEHKVTYKMERGKIAQDEIERLESRRKLTKYAIKEGSRRFDVWVHSKRWQLSGKLDMLIDTESVMIPVDFKFTRGRPYRNHIYQLGGYALILEDVWQKPVHKGFVYLILQQNAVAFDITDVLKEQCVRTLLEIREMVGRERFPEAPPQRAKCADCEYQNYCRDIW